MKKVFIVIASVFMAAVISLLIVLNSVKENDGIIHNSPYSISVYNKSSNPKVFDAEDSVYHDVIERINKISKMSLFDKLLKLKTLDSKMEINKDGTYVKWTPEISSGNYVIEIDYDKPQDVIVYEDGNTRVISYCCIYYVFNGLNDFSNVVAYYSLDRDETKKQTAYANCQPIVFDAYTDELVDYVKTVK